MIDTTTARLIASTDMMLAAARRDTAPKGKPRIVPTIAAMFSGKGA
ncbi:hypothetical protein [Sphingomonas sp. NFR15]|nr:hypothetical protein [Sphingomonas sp. NFR15]SDA14741.1 hypothetical protein SAMN03159340_00587 [Sphingomonas sp. NFR15]